MLNRLSTELVEMMAESLPDKSALLVLRRVCQRAYRATYRLFAIELFTTVTTDFTPRSLARPAYVSRNDDLAARIRCLCAGDCHRASEKKAPAQGAITRLRPLPIRALRKLSNGLGGHLG